MDEANNVGQIPTYISVYYLFQYSVPHALEPKRGIEQFVNGHPITKFEPEKKIKKRKKNKSRDRQDQERNNTLWRRGCGKGIEGSQDIRF